MLDIKQYLKSQIQAALNSLQKSSGATYNAQVFSTPVRIKDHFCTNIALQLSCALEIPAMSLADAICQQLPDPAGFIEKAVPANPGFINFRLSTTCFYTLLQDILNQGQAFGKSNDPNSAKVLLEFLSQAPIDSLEINGARAAAIGDTLIRLHQWSGHEAHSEYFINDNDRKANTLARTVDELYRAAFGESLESAPLSENTTFIKAIVNELVVAHGPAFFLKEDEERLNFFKRTVLERAALIQQKSLQTLGIHIDQRFYESDIVSDGKIRTVLGRLLGLGLVYDFDGCLWFKSSDFGDNEDRILIKSDGSATYFLIDLGYHLGKFERGFNLLVNIWNPDHQAYVQRMRIGLEALGYSNSQFQLLTIGHVHLVKDSIKLVVSERAGVHIGIDELLKELNADVLRYFLIRGSIHRPLEFSLDLARSGSRRNPLAYIQRVRRRLDGLFDKSKFVSNMRALTHFPKTIEAEEAALILQLTAFPNVVQKAANTIQPQLIPLYLEKFAANFNRFYSAHHILNNDPALTESRLFLCQAVKTVLDNALSLIGISAPGHKSGNYTD